MKVLIWKPVKVIFKVEVTFSKLEVKLNNSSRILTLQYIGYETITPGNRILYFIFTQTQNAGLAGHNFTEEKLSCVIYAKTIRKVTLKVMPSIFEENIIDAKTS